MKSQTTSCKWTKESSQHLSDDWELQNHIPLGLLEILPPHPQTLCNLFGMVLTKEPAAAVLWGATLGPPESCWSPASQKPTQSYTVTQLHLGAFIPENQLCVLCVSTEELVSGFP